jgi:Zn-finger nucleic acid-binding protein
MDMTCPKCSGPMRTYERNGVHVDQCADCRGIFLDRGELERLVDAETAWHGGASRSAASAPGGAGIGAVVTEVLGQARGHQKPRPDDRGYDERRYDDRRYDEYGRSYGSGHPRRKKSFLSELFD